MREINIETARKLWKVIGKGLVSGLGEQKPGQMCVEAAVCYVLDLPHGDDPKCVASAVRSFKIALNDKQWSSNKARAKGLRRVAIAQLGSRGVANGREFSKRMAEKTIRAILPIAFRAAANIHPSEHHRAELNRAADFCAAEGSRKNAISARSVAAAAYADADADADAADAAAKFKSRDEVLTMAADLCLETLRELNSPGVALLDQLEKEMAAA